MRIENYNAWLDNLTDEEYQQIKEDYGDNFREAYDDLMRELGKDFKVKKEGDNV